jgi:hypothetical protein
LDSVEDVKVFAADEKVVPSVELAGDSPLFEGLLSDRTSQLAAYRRRRSAVNERSVHPADVDEMLAKGWEVSRPGKRLTRIKQIKPHDQMLEDRAWSLLHLMGYDEINETGFSIKFRRTTGSVGSKQIDAFACDAETAVIIECKSRIDRGR